MIDVVLARCPGIITEVTGYPPIDLVECDTHINRSGHNVAE